MIPPILTKNNNNNANRHIHQDCRSCQRSSHTTHPPGHHSYTTQLLEHNILEYDGLYNKTTSPPMFKTLRSLRICAGSATINLQTVCKENYKPPHCSRPTLAQVMQSLRSRNPFQGPTRQDYPLSCDISFTTLSACSTGRLLPTYSYSESQNYEVFKKCTLQTTPKETTYYIEPNTRNKVSFSTK